MTRRLARRRDADSWLGDLTDGGFLDDRDDWWDPPDLEACSAQLLRWLHAELIELCDESPDEADNLPAHTPAPMAHDDARSVLADPERWYGEHTGGCTLVRATELGRSTPARSWP